MYYLILYPLRLFANEDETTIRKIFRKRFVYIYVCVYREMYIFLSEVIRYYLLFIIKVKIKEIYIPPVYDNLL